MLNKRSPFDLMNKGGKQRPLRRDNVYCNSCWLSLELSQSIGAELDGDVKRYMKARGIRIPRSTSGMKEIMAAGAGR